MRYYLSGYININSTIEKLKPFKIKELQENILLTNFGLMKYVKNNLFIFKLNNCNIGKEKSLDIEKENTLEIEYKIEKENEKIYNKYKSQLVETEDPWVKSNESRHQLLYNSYKLNVKRIVYAFSKNSNVCFVIELYDNSKIDYYFQVSNVGDIFYKNDICSILKNIN
tara:strand:+ start:389 stop:892 length:504 start_codon:yes stop_codon:yes gene_type:complete